MKKTFVASILGVMCLFSVGVVGKTVVEKVIPFPKEYDTTSSGASSYAGLGDVAESVYFPVLDFYNMKSTDTMTLLPQFKTYQQTTEYTCGPAAALTVLHHFGETGYEELQIAEMMGTHKDKNGSNEEEVGVADERGEYGTSTSGMVSFFEQIGWEVESSITMADESGYTFEGPEDARDYIVATLKENTPIMIENIDFGGHWRTIIGYDTMGTETIADDVVIFADPYDTSDHMQDGYGVMSMERFFYMWYDSHILPEDEQFQQFLTAKPAKKEVVKKKQ